MARLQEIVLYSTYRPEEAVTQLKDKSEQNRLRMLPVRDSSNRNQGLNMVCGS
jgi:hypothetical protein